MSKQINLRLPDPWAKHLKIAAANHETSRQALIEKALQMCPETRFPQDNET